MAKTPRLVIPLLKCQACPKGQRNGLPVYRCEVQGEAAVLCVRCIAKRAIREMPCRVKIKI